MGLLDQVLGGAGGARGGGGIGGMSPMTMALLGLLAYRTMNGKGRLADMLGRGGSQDAPTGANPFGNNANSGSGSGGGLGDLLGGGGGGGLGGLLGGAGNAGGGLGGLLGGGSGGAGGLGGLLGGLLGGGAAGGVLSGGLGDLLNRFQESGQGDVADSWVQKGPNKRIAREDLERALGSDTIDNLAAQSGMDRDDMLAGFERSLPEVVDKLTPNGRLPTKDEADSWL